MKRRILLADDELAILLTLKAILEMNGFEVETAASAKEAEQKLSASQFDMVITDMRMETAVSGFDVIRAARSSAAVPTIVILSAYPIAESDWRDAGAQACFNKPVSIVDLLSAIQGLLLGRTSHR